MSKILIASLFVVGFAFAEGPCKADREKFCKGMEKGEGLMKCMHEHKDQLSPECKAMGEKMKEAHQEVKAACKGDVETLCAGVEPGKGRIIQCMKDNKEKLSAGCKAELDEKKAKRKEMKHKHHKKHHGPKGEHQENDQTGN